MKPHRRIGSSRQNCLTLTTDGQLEKGIVVDQYRNEPGAPQDFHPTVYLRQGAKRSFKLLTYAALLTEVEMGQCRVFRARLLRDRFDNKLKLYPRADDSLLLYLPSYIAMPFGALYPEDPLEMVCGGVLHHPGGRYRDGHFVLGEAWEDDKTGIFRLAKHHRLMVGSRFKENDQWQTRVVTLVRREQFLIMRYPTRSEMSWFVKTNHDIRREEKAYRRRLDGQYEFMN